MRLMRSSTGAAWIALASRLLGPLVILPVVLAKWSSQDVALWLLFTSVASLQLMLDFGLSPTFARAVAYAKGGVALDRLTARVVEAQPLAQTPPDPKTVTALFIAILSTYRRLGVAVGVLALTAGSAAVWRAISTSDESTEAWAAWCVVAFGTGVAAFRLGYNTIATGSDAIGPLMRREAFCAIGGNVSALVVLTFEGGLFGVVLTQQVWNVFGMYLVARLTRKLPLWALVDWNDVGARRRRWTLVRAIWPRAWRSGVASVMSWGVIHVVGIVYSMWLVGPELASFLLSLRMMYFLNTFSQAPFYTKLPRLSMLVAQGRRSEGIELAGSGMRWALWSFSVPVVLVGAFMPGVLNLLGSDTLFVSRSFWWILSLAVFFERYGAMHLQFYMATNHVVGHIANGVTGFGILAFATSFFPMLDVYAFALASMVFYLGFYSWFCAMRSYQEFGMEIVKFESSTSFGPMLFLVLGVSFSMWGIY